MITINYTGYSITFQIVKPLLAVSDLIYWLGHYEVYRFGNFSLYVLKLSI